MFEINEKFIKEQVNELTYGRGFVYYVKNKVHYMNVEKKDDMNLNAEVTSIYGEVESSSDWEYSVEVVYNNKTGFMHLECDCEAFGQNYGGSHFCKHIVAVLLKFCKEGKVDLVKPRSKIDGLVDILKSNMVNTHKIKNNLNLEIKYELEGTRDRISSLELKVGENKSYVVKNMKDFIGTVKNKNTVIEYGKNFTFDPNQYEFKEEDKELLNLLIEIYEADNKVSNIYNSTSRYFGSNFRFLSGKKAYLTEAKLKRFLEAVKHRDIEMTLYGVPYSEVSIKEEDLPLQFNLTMEKDNIILEAEEDLPMLLTLDGEYFFFNNTIYKPSKEQLKFFMPFYHEFKNNKDILTFKREERDKLASYIVPSLKKISTSVNIDKRLENNFYEEPLNTNIYLDKDGDGITADVLFKYGNVQITPFNEKVKGEDNKALVRAIDEELSVVGILEGYGFLKGEHKFILKNEEKLVEFLTEGLVRLQDVGAVYYSEVFKNIKVYSSSNVKSSIRLNDSDLLEFTFNIEGVEREELKEILRALKEKKKYYKLKKGGFVSLESKELIDVGNLIEYLNIKDSDLEKDKILLAKYNALYIDQNLKQNNMTYVERNKRFRELVNNIRDIQEMDYNVPEYLEGIMRGYQKFGFKWFKTLSSCGFGGILADEMGLGKTLQTISFIASECRENGENKKPSLVVAPTSLVYNWKSEIEKFAPELKTLIISGSKGEREEQRKEIEESDVVITSYPLIRRDIEEYKSIDFRYCFLDEAQQIKNPTSMNAQSVKEIKSQGYFALTGTPLENSLTELWSIFDFIMPGYLSTQGKFSKKYEVPIIKDKDKKALEALNKHIKPFILRRLKKEVIKELPPKIEHKIVVEMTEEQKKVYAAYLASIKDEINREIRDKGFNRSKLQILSALTRLRQICCEPSVFIENYEGDSGKMLALEDILEESINGGHRILLFSQFTSVLKNIAKRLDNSEIDYMYLDGQTKSEARGEMVKEFNEGTSSVFLISLKAGGTGLNLTGADVVIHFDPWWNPAVEDQATDRAHRIGQKKTVEVIKLVARGSIEEKIYDLQEKKKEIIKSVIDDDKNEEFLISQMTENELQQLLTI